MPQLTKLLDLTWGNQNSISFTTSLLATIEWLSIEFVAQVAIVFTECGDMATVIF